MSPLLLLMIDAHHAHDCSLGRIRLKHRLRPLYSTRRAAFATIVKDADANIHRHDSVDYSIRQVSNKARALDVKVFRGFSISAREYILEQHRNSGKDLSMAQAVDVLMKNYDDDGNYIMQVEQESYYEPETYFAAIYNGAELEKMEFFSRQNGILGVVSAQLRRPAPREDDDSSGSEVISATIPSPHIYIANMRVHDKMRRQGVGKALLSSVVAHTLTLNEWVDETTSIPLVLSVENDNIGAIQLYRHFGFEFVEKNKFFGLMLLLPTSPKSLEC